MLAVHTVYLHNGAFVVLLQPPRYGAYSEDELCSEDDGSRYDVPGAKPDRLCNARLTTPRVQDCEFGQIYLQNISHFLHKLCIVVLLLGLAGFLQGWELVLEHIHQIRWSFRANTRLSSLTERRCSIDTPCTTTSRSRSFLPLDRGRYKRGRLFLKVAQLGRSFNSRARTGCSSAWFGFGRHTDTHTA